MNQLPLDTFRKILKYPPWQFWGLDNETVRLGTPCNQVVYEYAFQANDIGGRDDIRQAIETAEKKLRGFLQYPVAPTYLEGTIVNYPQYFLNGYSGNWSNVQLDDGKVIAIGVESLDIIETPAVTYYDEFDTGVNDTFTIEFQTTETDPNKIAIYFQETDRVDNEPVSEKYRIQPVQVQIDEGTGTCTIIGRSWLLVKPVLYQAYRRQNPLNPSEANNFVSAVEAYVRTTDPDGLTTDDAQGVFTWDAAPDWNWWGFCCDNATDPAATATALARVGIRDAELGIVTPGEAVYNSDTQTWNRVVPPWGDLCRPPQEVLVRYLAGFPTENGQMDSRMANAVAYLAMADLPERICACDTSNRTLWRFQQVMTQTGTDQETFAVTREMINNPLGNRYGHWMAWNEIKTLRLVRGAN